MKLLKKLARKLKNNRTKAIRVKPHKTLVVDNLVKIMFKDQAYTVKDLTIIYNAHYATAYKTDDKSELQISKCLDRHSKTKKARIIRHSNKPIMYVLK